MKKAGCIKTPRKEGEKTLTMVRKLGLINKELEIQRDEEFIYIPLTKQPSREELETLKKQMTDCKVTVHSFPERKKHGTSLAQVLEDKLSPQLLASLPRAIDFVGEIAIVEFPPELAACRTAIGEAILKEHQKVRTVLAKASAVGGKYRLREFTIVAGDPKTDTIHKEYGCQYYVDLAKAFFSPRLSFEHRRVASQVQEGEVVVDLFAGVGPFAIQIAKTHQNVAIYAVDANPDAIECLKKNVRLNRAVRKVHPILGDARQVVKDKLSGAADRVIMNLPENAIDFVDAACEAIKPSGGIVHFYSFVNKSDSLENLKARFANAVEKSERRVEEILLLRLVRETAPYEWQAALDVRVC
jgi:tRNA (guanine37-N1)-methyltransferase